MALRLEAAPELSAGVAAEPVTGLVLDQPWTAKLTERVQNLTVDQVRSQTRDQFVAGLTADLHGAAAEPGRPPAGSVGQGEQRMEPGPQVAIYATWRLPISVGWSNLGMPYLNQTNGGPTVLGNLLIGLREGLEASLVVSILAAYLVQSGRRAALPALWTGVGVAIAVSLGFGALLSYGPRGLSSEAEELIAGVLSILAVGLVTWMIFWMARTARSLSGDLRGKVDAAGSTWALALVGALAVGREGLETALFLWAATRTAASGATSATAPLAGALIGIALAVALGYLVHRGALRISLSKFFTWTGGFLILIAAGVLSYGVHELQEAHVLPGGDAVAYDVSHLIAPGGVLATLLRGIVNFSPVATVGQVLAWWAYLIPVGLLFWRQVGARGTPAVPAASQPHRVHQGARD